MRWTHARVVLKELDRRIWWSEIRKGDKPMTVHIHPAEKQKEYTDLLLDLLVRAHIPAMAEELLLREGKTARTA